MPVSDFECQIARGQIGRYLGGGPLSLRGPDRAWRGTSPSVGGLQGPRRGAAGRRCWRQLGGEMPDPRGRLELPVAAENPLVAALRAQAPRAKPRPRRRKPRLRRSPRRAMSKAEAKVGSKPSLRQADRVLAALAGGRAGGHELRFARAHATGRRGAGPTRGVGAELRRRRSLPLGTEDDGARRRPRSPKPIESRKPCDGCHAHAQTLANRSSSRSPTRPKPRRRVKARVPQSAVSPVIAKPQGRRGRATKLACTKAPSKLPPAQRRSRPKKSPRTTVRVYGLDGKVP